MRRYKSGTGWCVWRWTDVDWQGETYMLRLHLLKTPWFAVMLHWIKGPDPAPDPHDHPVSFLSLTVRGWYAENLFDQLGALYSVRFGPLRWTPAYQMHRITLTKPGTLTLVVCGPVSRRWGYLTRKGWVDWKTYRDEHAR